jgi:hypothetical protein
MFSRVAERDRSDPRVGTDSVMRKSQDKMVTFVNGNVWRVERVRLVDVAGVHIRGQQNATADYSAEPRSI